MAHTVFTKVDYDLASLTKFIELGEIGLPDIQRPFVWKNNKVRDLFDSMYSGYPIGYLLFWKNGLSDDSKSIGDETKQKHPSLLIVDGQQRLTSLYAVIRGIPVIRENYQSEQIYIAFNPLQEKFEVADAAIRRDKSYIHDISQLWATDTKITKVIKNYISDLKESREVTEKDEDTIEDSILKLQGLLSFPFTALELDADITEEDVADVFVRINSKGISLSQADFVLTLMSVFWDEGRAELERFCRDSRTPAVDAPSPFNHFIKPSPDQLLRISVGLGFKRARFKYVYSILRGKNLETEEFSDELRVEQFGVLENAQSRTLNLQYWHDFMNCVRQAGFRSGSVISSQNNLLFSYILYLIGRTEYNVNEYKLRKVISRWFFMSALTGRYTGSPESAMEFDLARFREVNDGDTFIAILERICEMTMSEDYWTMTLPNDLATSSPRSPSLFAYNAALVLLDAKALFSPLTMSDLLDPTIQSIRTVERHHLFPKGYLKQLDITSLRDTNQIANYAMLEWADNMDISDQSPAEYMPNMKTRFTGAELEKMYHYHALPEDWENMDYNYFLERRRELIAKIIAEGYKTLVSGPPEHEEKVLTIDELVGVGENNENEFKGTLRVNMHTGNKDPKMEHAVLKTIAGFLNTNNGRLVIGVADDGTPIGIEVDGFQNEDKMALHLVNLVNARMGPTAMVNVHPRFEDYEGSRVMIVQCIKSKVPVYLKDGQKEQFFIRTGPSSTELTVSQTQEYINQRF